ncbi:molybdenum cofactor guanylyltransferase MobA [Rhodovibrio salinarum]|uniref:Molybdenum cofactor guanylyltransferase n=1 Tax=Rhodovibrio salinarum TaxID=1087 RepID=A0A934QIF2_9PROT|nr:molybdenum cofactor guanylyltransferase MobA [Rhodovibrio salinarum]MBK1697368.1 molybdenum cofactor guanylyltransferase MobA [Rhodovibrio salinarum]
MAEAIRGAPDNPHAPAACGVLLAGGQSRRMGGGDKTLRKLGDRTILQHVIDRAAPQVERLILNANGDPHRFAEVRLPVAPDVVDGFAGPLAGVLTGMEWAARHAPEVTWIATFACDAPFLPRELVARLRQAVSDADADLACAASNGRSHPVFGLWRVDLRHDLRQAMIDEDIRKVDVWTARHKLVTVDFPLETRADGPRDPFFNANHPDDLAEAERLLATG